MNVAGLEGWGWRGYTKSDSAMTDVSMDSTFIMSVFPQYGAELT